MPFSETFKKQYTPSILLDACNMNCPLPLLKLKQALHQAQPKNIVYIITTDNNSPTDIVRYCNRGNNTVLFQKQIDSICHTLVKKN